MIIATIPHKCENLKVEVTDVFMGGSGVKLACVRALAGKPFTSWTHGGWCESDTTRFPADLLRDVAVSPDELDECSCVLPEQSCPVCRKQAAAISPEDELPYERIQKPHSPECQCNECYYGQDLAKWAFHALEY